MPTFPVRTAPLHRRAVSPSKDSTARAQSHLDSVQSLHPSPGPGLPPGSDRDSGSQGDVRAGLPSPTDTHPNTRDDAGRAARPPCPSRRTPTRAGPASTSAAPARGVPARPGLRLSASAGPGRRPRPDTWRRAGGAGPGCRRAACGAAPATGGPGPAPVYRDGRGRRVRAAAAPAHALLGSPCARAAPALGAPARAARAVVGGRGVGLVRRPDRRLSGCPAARRTA